MELQVGLLSQTEVLGVQVGSLKAGVPLNGTREGAQPSASLLEDHPPTAAATKLGKEVLQGTWVWGCARGAVFVGLCSSPGLHLLQTRLVPWVECVSVPGTLYLRLLRFRGG